MNVLPATKAFVFLVVWFTENWKLPIAYFLVMPLNASEKANLIKEALIRLHNSGVYVFLDLCHMLKLMRNMFSELRTFLNDDGEAVEWKYVEWLYKIELNEGLSLATKLKKNHGMMKTKGESESYVP